MENFDEFVQEAIAEIKRNPHKYPSFCRGMVEKLDRLTAERDRYKTALEFIRAGLHKPNLCGNELQVFNVADKALSQEAP